MAKSSGPFFYSQKNSFYAWHQGKRVSLKTRDEKEAVRRWHLLMAGIELTEPQKPEAEKPKPEPKHSPEKPIVTVQDLVHSFLADAEKRMTKACLRNYSLFFDHLVASLGQQEAESISADQVERLSHKPSWSISYRSGFLGSVITLFRWALKRKRITLNPIADLVKPTKASRGCEAVISEADHKKLLEHAEPLFADFLNLLWMTGARPGEVTSITAEMVHKMTNGVMPLVKHKTAHKGKARHLILSPEAVEILRKRAVNLEPKAKVFPLSLKAVPARMSRLCQKAGVQAIAYGYRHTFATDALAKGLSDSTVAALLGHCDTSMVHKHYSHLSSRTRTLQDALAKVRG